MASDNILDYRPLELMLNPDITQFEEKDFIGVWKNFMPAPLCDQIVEYCDTVINQGVSVGPDDYVTEKDRAYDSAQYYGGTMNRKDFAFLMNYSNYDMVTGINSILKSCVKHYAHLFDTLKRSPLVSIDIKCQKTPPGGGYHLWHYEDTGIAHAQRELVWMIYLNDMPDGEAETEFLYQKRRIKPTKGTVVIWPAGYTHTHKGNTVLTQDKYILTGWYIKSK